MSCINIAWWISCEDFRAKALAQAIDVQLVDEEWRWHNSALDSIRHCSAVQDLKILEAYLQPFTFRSFC